MYRRKNSTDIFIDAWCPGTGEQEIPEWELLEGELSAVVFRVGCYIVRSAQRIYKIYEPDYRPELETPANKEETEKIRVAGGSKVIECELGTWLKFRLVQEISARHIFSPDSAFTYICRAAKARNHTWQEYIGDIYAVKEHEKIPDKDAFLLIYLGYAGSSYTSETWYKMSPDGKVTVAG